MKESFTMGFFDFLKKSAEPAAPAAPAFPVTLAADAKGTVVAMENIPDEVFAQGILGKCCGIDPTEGKIYAPADGEITQAPDSGHALGIMTTAGVEVLIHVGVDTVEMKGDGFSPKVKEGDKVKKGQILAEMDKTQYNTNALQLANAELDFARMKPVYETGGISKQEIDAAETNINVLKETVSNLEENVTLRSPFDGVVTARYNEEGDLFSSMSGTGIYQVMQMNPLKAYVFVSEQYFPQVYIGMPVEVKVDVYPDQVFSGKVSRIAPAIDPTSRTFEVEVTVGNSALTLRPGMYARTTFNMGEVDNVTVLDVAIQRQTGTNDKYVYVLKDDGTVESRFVTTGRQVGDRIEVLAGLAEGEKVVIAGSARLLDGMKVQVIEGAQQ